MAPAGVPAILILTALLSAAAAPHESTAPPSLANATVPRLLGMWQYVAGAAQLPQHLLELLLIDHGHLNVEPGSGQELLVTQHVAVGDRCLSNNSTSIRLGADGTALLLHGEERCDAFQSRSLSQPRLCPLEAETQRILGTVTQLGSEDSLLIQHHVQRERTYSALYLYGAVPSGRKGKNGRKEGWRRARHSPAEHPNRQPAAINALLRAIAPPEQDLQKGTERLVCFVCHCPQRLGQAVLAASRAAGPAVETEQNLF